jgi:hypothetical protein
MKPLPRLAGASQLQLAGAYQPRLAGASQPKLAGAHLYSLAGAHLYKLAGAAYIMLPIPQHLPSQQIKSAKIEAKEDHHLPACLKTGKRQEDLKPSLMTL